MPVAPPQRITYYVSQFSSAIITAAFSLRGVAIVPNMLTWTLSDDQGNVINSRKDVPIIPASSVSIVLSGNDLMLIEPFDDYVRILTVNGTYSSIDGQNLTLAGQYLFGITALPGGD
jgi:hypothetical protein